MNAKTVFWLAILLAVSAKLGKPQTETATNAQKLVSPLDYGAIPMDIRTELQKHKCYLPEAQSLDKGKEPINAVSGYFAVKGHLDWAALCVIGDRPQIFVLWHKKSLPCPSEIHSGWPLREKFSQEPAGGIFLRKARPQRILNYRTGFPEGETPVVTHDGLEVGNEQASLIYYCESGKWIELRGSD